MIRTLIVIAASLSLLVIAGYSTEARADKSGPSKAGKSEKAPSKTRAASPAKSKSKSKKGDAPSKGKKTKKAKKGKKGKAAAKGKSASAAGKKTKTVIFGEGDELEGDVKLPDGDDNVVRGDPGHSSLIQVRSHFIPEILKQAEKI